MASKQLPDLGEDNSNLPDLPDTTQSCKLLHNVILQYTCTCNLLFTLLVMTILDK